MYVIIHTYKHIETLMVQKNLLNLLKILREH